MNEKRNQILIDKLILKYARIFGPIAWNTLLLCWQMGRKPNGKEVATETKRVIREMTTHRRNVSVENESSK